ncbi:MAG: hypothetical protein ATN35_01320 [Epulopiscium sp. Nele67-Bin004]|nr:MAG: hypothetical protein ATN35_01320 [Epulopiscium sp. Nele67-Bin004]
MENILEVAQYIINKRDDVKEDEMKLHKLLYFVQKESLIQYDKPLFEEEFEAWKFGPVLLKVRKVFKDKEQLLQQNKIPVKLNENSKLIINKVIDSYADKNSWSLSRITHAEESWKRARVGLPDGENGDRPMLLENIRIDANKMKARRRFLAQSGEKEFQKYQIILTDEAEEELSKIEPAIDINKQHKQIKSRFLNQFKK